MNRYKRCLVIFVGILLLSRNLCHAQEMIDNRKVALIGTIDIQHEDAVQGQDYAETRGSVINNDGRTLLYDPGKGRYNVKRRFIIVKEVRDEYNKTVTGMDGRFIEIIGKTLQNVDPFLGRVLRLTGMMRCGRFFDMSSWEEVKEDGAGSNSGGCSLPSCTYRLSRQSIFVNPSSHSTEIYIQGTGQEECYEPILPENLGWAKASLQDWKNNEGKIEIEINANNSALKRMVNLRIENVDFVVYQTGAPCSVAGLDPKVPNVPGSGGTGEMAVMVKPSECGWTVKTSSPWIHIASANQCGQRTFTYSADANDTQADRTGTIDVILWGSEKEGTKVLVTQGMR